jgi:putative ABC transport system permease protein
MPEWKTEVARRLRELAPGQAPAEELTEELAQHLEERYLELRAAGRTEDEAQSAALEELVPGDALHGVLRGSARLAETPTLGHPSSGGFLDGLAADVRFGLRALRKSRSFTAVALLTLALGIGATSAVFSVVNAVLLRPLPFAEPDRLVTFWGSAPEMGLSVVNYPDALYVYFRNRSRTLQDVSAYASLGMTLAGGADDPEQLQGAAVTVDFFRLLGHAPLHGRTFLPEEALKDRNRVAVLSHALWQRRFGGDPAIVGSALVLDGRPVTVVGIMPPRFDFPRHPGPSQLWVPLGVEPESLGCFCWSTMGRLAPGQTPNDAAREISRLTDDFWRDREGKPRIDPNGGEASKAIVIARPLARNLVFEVRTPLLVLLGAVGMVLLIACANVANLQLSRATARVREIAVRCCLGASPWRIARQLLIESLLLAAGGAALGLGLAYASLRAIRHLVAAQVAYVDQVELDPRVLSFTVAVTLAAGVLFGLAPAWRGARIELQEAVKVGARGSRGKHHQRMNEKFVVSQFALSLVLLIGAGLLLRSFRNMLDVDLGFRPESVLVGRMSFPVAALPEPPRVRAFYAQLAERVRGLPGVRSVGLSSIAPFSKGENQQIFMIRGREPAPGQPNLVARIRTVTPGYFTAVGTPLLRGRVVDETDSAEGPPVAVVDESLARRFWPDGNAVGQQIRLGDSSSTSPWCTIVGVVANVKHGDVIEDAVRYVYLPHAQSPTPFMDLIVRTATDPTALTEAIRREVRSLDPTLPFYEVQTLELAVSRTLDTPRLTQRLLLGFAVAALLLAALGIYGVMALNVHHRVNEFGIRQALGATSGEVLAMVLRQGLRLALLGAAAGLLVALALARAVKSLLFGVKPFDPITLGAVALLLVLVAVVACYLPARRASATDPLVALRCE